MTLFFQGPRLGLGLGLGLPDDTNVAPGLTSINSTRQHTQQALMELSDKDYNNEPYKLATAYSTQNMSQMDLKQLQKPKDATHLLILWLPIAEKEKLVWLDMRKHLTPKMYFRSPVNNTKTWYAIKDMYYNNDEQTLHIKYTIEGRLTSMMEITHFRRSAKDSLTLRTISNGTYMGALLRW